jgi:2-dehydro-3-deoxy-D-gluconate 5-dehydrogenase
MDLGIADQVAIVTGASRGLGFCAAQALADEGARVLAVARSSAGLERLAESRPSLIAPLACDLRDLDAVEALPAAAIERFGRLDIVVNNAGIAPAGGFIEITRELLDEVMVLNVEVPALLTRAAGQVFIERGGGKVINVASISGIRGKATLVAYSASKGALVQLTKALAAEWARYNIQVNAIAPGGFVTEAQAAVTSSPEMLARRVRKIPARRMADATEIGPLVCVLASPLMNFITGEVVVIDGGETAKI